MNESISLIVCTLGRTDKLERLLSSLRLQNFGDFEIIIVDQNASGFLDAVVRQFSDLPLRHVRSQKGLSLGRNVGLTQCRGEIIGFPDDDCWYSPNVVRSVYDFFAHHPDIALYTGRTVDGNGLDSVSRHLPRSTSIKANQVFFVGNSNTIFVRKDAALAVNGFDESLGVGTSTPFKSGEESDFLLRCLTAGHSGFYDHELIIHHDQVATSVERASTYARGFGRVVRIHNFGVWFFLTRSMRTFVGSGLRLARGDIAGARERFAWLRGSAEGYLARCEPQTRIASMLDLKRSKSPRLNS